MKRVKTIRRQWVTKTGVTKYKEYEYRTSGATLVSKTGKVNKTKVEAYKRSIDANTSYNDKEKTTIKNQIDMKVWQASRKKERLTERTFESKIANSKREKYIINLGYDTETLASELGIDEAALLNEENWKSDMLSVGGQSWKFTWTYQGSAYERQ